jgi:hypothetical protein
MWIVHTSLAAKSSSLVRTVPSIVQKSNEENKIAADEDAITNKIAADVIRAFFNPDVIRESSHDSLHSDKLSGSRLIDT